VDNSYNSHLSQESNRETDKADGFADDNSTATMCEFDSLNMLKKINFDFAKFSGLQCNVEKTTLMQFGQVQPLSDEIKSLGFTCVEEFTLLGLVVNRDLSSLPNHFEDTIRKITQMIEYWDRFYLSLPGRISICKTFLLSQIGYIGCIVSPTADQEKRLQNILDSFCVGKMRTAAKKLYTPISEGGLGLIKISEFITSLQCAWVKRVTQHWGDTWRYDIKRKCYGNPLILDKFTFSVRENPILSNIGNSFGKFRAAFTEKDENYRKAVVFKNPFFRRGRNDDRMLCESFFNIRNNFEMCCKVAKMKYEDFFIRERPKSLNDLNFEFGLDFNLATYMRIHEALQFTKDSRREGDSKPTQSLEFFLKSFDKGSKPYRRILRFKENSKLKISTLNTVKSFFEIVGLQMVNDDILHICWGEWQRNYYGNRCKEFIYKFRNNILGINQRVCKFVPDVGAECDICRVSKEPLPINTESFLHLFFECPHTSRYRNIVIENFFPELANATEEQMKNFWFLGIMPNTRKVNPFVSCMVTEVNFYIWKMKLNKSLLPLGIFIQDLSYTMYSVLKMSNKLCELRQASDLFVCRHTFDPP